MIHGGNFYQEEKVQEGKVLLKMNRRQEVQLQWTPWPLMSRISQQVGSIITSLSAFKKLA